MQLSIADHNMAAKRHDDCNFPGFRQGHLSLLWILGIQSTHASIIVIRYSVGAVTIRILAPWSPQKQNSSVAILPVFESARDPGCVALSSCHGFLSAKSRLCIRRALVVPSRLYQAGFPRLSTSTIFGELLSLRGSQEPGGIQLLVLSRLPCLLEVLVLSFAWDANWLDVA